MTMSEEAKAVHTSANTGAHTRNKPKSSGNIPGNGSGETARNAANTSGAIGKGKRRRKIYPPGGCSEKS